MSGEGDNRLFCIYNILIEQREDKRETRRKHKKELEKDKERFLAAEKKEYVRTFPR